MNNDLKTLGKIAYDAYCGARQWKSVRGEALPQWELQSPELRQAWEAAAATVCGTTHVGSDTWPLVCRFAEAMETKLDLNRHKGGAKHWRNQPIAWLFQRLMQETDELAMAINGGCVECISAEAADVGNFAMMIQDWYLSRSLESCAKVPGLPQRFQLSCDDCGKPIGEDGHIDVADRNGETVMLGRRCRRCEEAKP